MAREGRREEEILGSSAPHRCRLFLCVLQTCCGSSARVQVQDAPGRRSEPAPVMGWRDRGLALERTEHDVEEKPEALLDLFDLDFSEYVADLVLRHWIFGASDGAAPDRRGTPLFRRHGDTHASSSCGDSLPRVPTRTSSRCWRTKQTPGFPRARSTSYLLVDVYHLPEL